MQRSAANHFTLDTDPDAWGENYERGVRQYGLRDGENCVLCGKRTGGKKNTVFVLVTIYGKIIPFAEVAGLPGFDHGLAQGEFPIGSECKKKIDKKFWIVEG